MIQETDINFSLKISILNSFRYSNNYHNIEILENEGAFKKFFIIDTSKDIFEIPTFLRNSIEKVFDNNEKVTKIVANLYACNQISKKSSESIIKEAFRGFGILKFIIKDDIYYCGNGIIMDKDYNILLLHSLSCNIVEIKNKQYINYNTPIVRVSPKVFLNDDILSKYIIKKMIPVYLLCSMPKIYSTLSDFTIDSDLYEVDKIKLLIEDPNIFLKDRMPLTVSENINDSINEFLTNNKKELHNSIIHNLNY